jgi:hypothetical protein
LRGVERRPHRRGAARRGRFEKAHLLLHACSPSLAVAKPPGQRLRVAGAERRARCERVATEGGRRVGRANPCATAAVVPVIGAVPSIRRGSTSACHRAGREGGTVFRGDASTPTPAALGLRADATRGRSSPAPDSRRGAAGDGYCALQRVGARRTCFAGRHPGP